MAGTQLPPRLADVAVRELVEGRTLFLKSRGLDDADVVALAPHLAQNGALRELYLGFNSFGDEGAKALCEALGTAAEAAGQRLTLLGLRHCRLGDGAAEAVAELLRRAPSLDDVGVDENSIGDAGAEALAAALPESKTLRELYVGDNAMTEEGQAKLKAAAASRPGLTVHFRR
mmetsp:Transcript_89001/g.287820  ORF Transcript_89001/g.287820 Transcript_89001/m.287820 type:complete len:173 (-) Transcript_89001:83-601(-)